MIKRSVIIAVALGILTGSLLFVFIKDVSSKNPTPAQTNVKLFDIKNTLLYEGPLDPQSKKDYKRAPYAVDLTLEKVKKSYEEKEIPSNITTSIDLPLQNHIQQTLLENQGIWQENNVKGVAVLVFDGLDRSLRAAVGSENYYQDPSSPAALISTETLNVISKQVCSGTRDRQILILTTNNQGIVTEEADIKATVIQKINEFENTRGGEIYGQN